MATPTIELPPPNTPYWLIAFVLVAFLFPVLGLLSKAFDRLLDFASKIIVRPSEKSSTNIQQIGESPEIQARLDAIDRNNGSIDRRVEGNSESIRDINREISQINKEIHDLAMSNIRK